MKGKVASILLISLFVSYLLGLLTDANIIQSGLMSLDKLIRLGVLYVAVIVALLNARGLSSSREFFLYFWPGVITVLILSAHYFHISAETEHMYEAKKEIFRLIGLLTFFIVFNSMDKMFEHRTLIKGLTLLGVVTGILSIHHSFTGSSEKVGGFVEGYLRAGVGITDANGLGAFLNIATMAAFAGMIIANKMHFRILYFCAILVLQAGRLFTFSNGSLVGIILSVAFLLISSRTYDRALFKKTSRLLLLIAVMLLAMAPVFSEMMEPLLYRAKLSDAYVLESSVLSRVYQHISFYESVKEEPIRLLYGYGSAMLPEKIGGLTLHNSYLRPLATGGIVVFICFAFMWYHSLMNLKNACKRENDSNKTVSIVFYATFMGWSVQAATLPYDTSIIQWFFFMLAFLLSGQSQESKQTKLRLL